ncbi:MAG TPA: alpha/beta fold hydrolase [Candidatus Paceibacterota bacterium]|jgi:pimeloyl-ACP methyl ester carboxylesterase|nr:alpha/beta fold hydrolase [Candidatus Paceibacterota bacterium]
MEHIPSQAENFESNFDEQFKKREEIDLFGTKFEIVDIHPDIESTPVPILIAPGWTEDMESFKEGMRMLVEKGRRVLSLEHPRYGNEMDAVDEDLKKLYPVDELRKALALLAVIDQKGLGPVDVIAHSEGGINTAIAATLETEKFHRIVFANSAGLLGPDNFPRLSTRFNTFTLNEIKNLIYSDDLKRQTGIQNMLGKITEYIAANFVRATKESVAISEVQIQDMIKYLHDEGVGITILNSEDDIVFPPEKVKEIVDAKHVDNYVTLPGGHGEIALNPREYMDVINQAFIQGEIAKS